MIQMNITTQRKQEILKKFETDKDLFNWCEEYKQFVNESVHQCVSSEWDYILKKSVEDSNTPFSYEDINLFDTDKAKEHALYNYDTNEKKYTEYANNPDTFNRKVENAADFEVFLNSLTKNELETLFEDLKLDTDDARVEIYEWWIISDPLAYRLEKSDCIFVGGAWGRQTTGQSISLDYCVIKAFISWLNDSYTS